MGGEGPTDGAVAVGRGAAGMAAVSSTDMGAAGAGVDVATAGGAGGGLAGRHRAGKQAKMTRNQQRRLKKQRERDG